MGVSLESRPENFQNQLEKKEPRSQFFDIRKTLDFYSGLVTEFGPFKAQIILQNVLAEDLLSQAWEVVKTRDPYHFRYYIMEVGGETRLVHESDRHNNKDILGAIDPTVQDGLEFGQIFNAKDRLFKAENDQTFFVMSPRGHNHKDSFLTVLELHKRDQDGKIEGVLVEDEQVKGWVNSRQFKSEFLDLEKSASLVSVLAKKKLLAGSPSREELMLTVGDSDLALSTEQINRAIEDITGVKITDNANMEQIKKKAIENSRELLKAIVQGKTPQELERLHAKLLIDTVAGQPSDRVKYGSDGSITIVGDCTFISISNSLMNLRAEKQTPKKCDAGHLNTCYVNNTCNFCGGKLKD